MGNFARVIDGPHEDLYGKVREREEGERERGEGGRERGREGER